MKRIFLAIILPFLILPSHESVAQVGDIPTGVVNTQKPTDRPPTADESIRLMRLPEGFRVQTFADEPDVCQPIAFSFDDRGRLWVAESYSYIEWKRRGRDRVLIFEDIDGDGRFDKRKVFWDKGHHISGLIYGLGGVWITSPPNLLFIPDENRDDVPDGPPVVHLDGWTTKAEHNFVNGLTWGLDGWLYGRHGMKWSSNVGKPGATDDERVTLSCCIWRYHPTRKTFEVVADGTVNPWGLDFDDYGEAFITTNVIDHLWHLIPGAHYQSIAGQKNPSWWNYNPHTAFLYELIGPTCDHVHWDRSVDAETGDHSDKGGGSAHCGTMIYLGDNWPDEYRGKILMCNVHGHRVNMDRLQRRGSGYVGRHEPDFLMGNSPWFRGVSLKYGPDGGVFLSEWTDLGECHDRDGVHRTSGRIYKITAGEPRQIAAFDLARESNARLAQLQLHKNDWYVRHARRLLQERQIAGRDMSDAVGVLRDIFDTNDDVTRQLRAMWALHACDGLADKLLEDCLGHANEHVRSWAVRLLCDNKDPPPGALTKLTAMAGEEPSALVRLYLAAAMQRMPLDARWEIAMKLVGHAEDSDDRNVPLMIWYGIEPAVSMDEKRAISLASASKIPLLRRFIARRLSE